MLAILVTASSQIKCHTQKVTQGYKGSVAIAAQHSAIYSGRRSRTTAPITRKVAFALRSHFRINCHPQVRHVQFMNRPVIVMWFGLEAVHDMWQSGSRRPRIRDLVQIQRTDVWRRPQSPHTINYYR